MDDSLIKDLLTAVEQQLLSPQTRYVDATFQRLCADGLTEEEAKEEIAWCLAEAMDRMMREHRHFDEAAYREALAQLG